MKLIALAPNIVVENIEKTVKYYKKLGFELINSIQNDAGVGQWAMVQTGNVRLMFQLKENLANEIAPVRDLSIGASINFYINMEGIDSFFEQIKDTVNVVNELKLGLYGANEFTIQDLNGYFLTFAEIAD